MTTSPPKLPPLVRAPVDPAGRPGVSALPPLDTPGTNPPPSVTPRAEGGGQTPAGSLHKQCPLSAGHLSAWPQPPAAADVIVSLTLDVAPAPKGRPRVSPAEYTVLGGAKVQTKKAHGYTPERTRDFEDKVGWALRQAKVRRNDTDLLGVRAIFHVGGNWDTRPDLDNCLKALLDACNVIVYADDQQVVEHVTSMIPADGKPCVEFTVYIVRGGAR